MSDAPRQLPPKKEVALALLEGPSLLIHLDPRREGVVVPKWFAGQPQLVLQVGLNLPVPIPDLTVDETGISCTLSFSRSPFWCHIPWSAVYALVGDDGRGMVWPSDVPPEVAAQMQKASSSAAPPAKGGKKPKAKLAAVGSRDADAPRPTARARSRAEARTPEPDAAESSQAEASADASADAARPREGAAPARRGPRAAPKLAAAPSPTPTPAPVTPIAAAEEPRDASKGQKPRQGGPADSKKPKRELPPYLRVIK